MEEVERRRAISEAGIELREIQVVNSENQAKLENLVFSYFTPRASNSLSFNFITSF